MRVIYVYFVAMVILQGVFAGCQERFEMIPPPDPEGPSAGETRGVFVKIDGTGKGTSWDDALSGAEFFAKVRNGYAPSDTVYMAGGTYYAGETKNAGLNITQNIIIKGGFNPNSTGNSVEIVYPSTAETIFSGDLNKNSIPDDGDCWVLDLSGGCTVSLTGITIKDGYVAEGSNHPGLQVKGSSVINLNYCKIINNTLATTVTNLEAGGAGIYMSQASVNCYKTVIAGNTANNRGGGIRLTNASDILVLNSSLLADNKVTGSFGGGIQMSSTDAKIYCINSTITGNAANAGGAGINGGGWIYIVSSTIAGNYCNDGKNGHDLRIESANKAFVINSIITGSGDKVKTESPNIFINGANYNVTSVGNNIIGVASGAGNFIVQPSDVTGKFYADIFGVNELANNDGFPQTIALKSNFTGASAMTIYTYMLTNVPYGDITLDQRGFTRNDPASVGAFEYK
jgi:hypothetical protein